MTGRSKVELIKANLVVVVAHREGRTKDILLSPDGRVENVHGFYVLDEDAARLAIAAFERRGIDLVIDYEHQSLDGGKAPAAGWVSKLRYEKGRGLIGQVKWNEEAKSMIQSDEYRYLSPVLGIDPDTHRVVSLDSAGLTNRPAIHHMEVVAASRSGKRVSKKELQAMAEEPGMMSGPSVDMLIGQIMTKLGITLEEGKEGDTIVALKAILEAVDGADAADADGEQPAEEETVAASVRKALDLAGDADGKTVMAALSQLKAKPGMVPVTKYNELQRSVNAMQEREAQRRSEELVAFGLSEHKLNKDDKGMMDWARGFAKRDPDGFKLTLSNMTAFVQPGRTVPPDESGADSSAVAKQEKMIADAVEKHGNYGDAIVELQTGLMASFTRDGLNTRAARQRCENQYPKIFLVA